MFLHDARLVIRAEKCSGKETGQLVQNSLLLLRLLLLLILFGLVVVKLSWYADAYVIALASVFLRQVPLFTLPIWLFNRFGGLDS